MLKGCSTRQFFCFVLFHSEKNIIYKSGQPQEDPGKGQLKRFWSIKKYFSFFFFSPTRFWVTKVLVQFKNDDDNKIIYIYKLGFVLWFFFAFCWDARWFRTGSSPILHDRLSQVLVRYTSFKKTKAQGYVCVCTCMLCVAAAGIAWKKG